MEKKITKRDRFTSIIEALGLIENTEDLIEFCNAEIALLDKKADKAKERSAKKKSEVDALKDAIAEVVGDDYMTIGDVVIALNDEEATANKCIYRLNKLVAEGVLEKAEVVIEGESKKRHVMAFRKAGVEVEAE